jgi:hypothetical protein
VHTLRYASLATRLRVALYIFLLLLALATTTQCLPRFFNRLFGPHFRPFLLFLVWHAQ